MLAKRSSSFTPLSPLDRLSFASAIGSAEHTSQITGGQLINGLNTMTMTANNKIHIIILIKTFIGHRTSRSFYLGAHIT